MKWVCPGDWKYTPKKRPASDGMLMSMIFDGKKRWRTKRNPWFRRCNASGKWIWPGQKMWYGIVTFKGPPVDTNRGGSYVIAFLNADQYLVQKLKGNI